MSDKLEVGQKRIFKHFPVDSNKYVIVLAVTNGFVIYKYEDDFGEFSSARSYFEQKTTPYIEPKEPEEIEIVEYINDGYVLKLTLEKFNKYERDSDRKIIRRYKVKLEEK